MILERILSARSDGTTRLSLIDGALLGARTHSLPLALAYRFASISSFEQACEQLRELLSTCPWVESALYASSPTLRSALSALLGSASVEKKQQNLVKRSVAYVTRMASRTTPFGLFSSCSLIDVGPSTRLRYSFKSSRLSARPDMGWLGDLIATVENELVTTEGLVIFFNTNYVERGGRTYFSSENHTLISSDHKVKFSPKSVRTTPFLKRVEQLSATGVKISQLVKALSIEIGTNELERISRSIRHLFDAGAFVSELRFSPVDFDYRKIFDIVREKCPERAVKLGTTQIAFERVMISGSSLPINKLLELDSELHELTPGPSPRFQLDLVDTTYGTLPRHVFDQVARLGELMLSVSGVLNLKMYRDKFFKRYEGEQLVPLLELLDERCGIGEPDYELGVEKPNADRLRKLSAFVADALVRRVLEIEVSERDLSILCPPLPAEFMPERVELGFYICSASEANIDEGNYTVCSGSYVGSIGLSASLARFAHMWSDETRESFKIPSAGMPPDAVDAELVFSPAVRRYANVMTRPSSCTHEIRLGISESRGQSLDLRSLYVSVNEGRFVIWSSELDGYIRINETHLMNSLKSSAGAAKFLSLVSRADRGWPAAFDWSGLETPFLPRLRFGTIVLSLARWSLSPIDFEELSFDTATERIREFCDRWMVPEFVQLCATYGDNRLLIKPRSAFGIQQILDTMETAKGNGSTVRIEEPYVLDGAGWSNGDTGSNLFEFVASFSTSARKTSITRKRVHYDRVSSAKTFGTTWLSYQIYGSDEDAFLAENVSRLVNSLEEANLLQNWFFLRYFDTDRHIRLRFQCLDVINTVRDPIESMLGTLFREKKIFDVKHVVYFPELERYGNSHLDAWIHPWFTLNSDNALEVMNEVLTRGVDFTRLALQGAISIIDAWVNHGLIERPFDVCIAPNPKLPKHAWDQLKNLGKGGESDHPHDHRRLNNLLSAATEFASGNPSPTPMKSICSSLLHMHFNRLNVNNMDEKLARKMLWQHYASIAARARLNAI